MTDRMENEGRNKSSVTLSFWLEPLGGDGKLCLRNIIQAENEVWMDGNAQLVVNVWV